MTVEQTLAHNSLGWKMNSRQKLIIVMVVVVVAIAMAAVMSTIPMMAGAHTSDSVIVGNWVYQDQYGRKVTWLISRDGTMKRFASDDPTDVDEFQWWTSMGHLVLRPPISTTDHVYHAAEFALNGRKFDDQRVGLRISQSNPASLTLTSNDGPVIVMTRKQDDAR